MRSSSAAKLLGASVVILTFGRIAERVDGFVRVVSPQQPPHWSRQNDSERAVVVVPVALFAAPPPPSHTSSFDPQSRRTWLSRSVVVVGSTATALISSQQPAVGNEFAPGGTLVDYKVGVTVGNAEASPSRQPDNSNVLFDRDYYFKFGTAAPWIPPGNTDFPKSIPFVPSQQRYDALKKYRGRILLGVANIRALETYAEPSNIADPTALDVYYLRPMGLLANSLLASENTGSTNELYLARWYINEILLHIMDLRNTSTSSSSSDDNKDPPTLASYGALRKALNSYLTLMNRAITEKVGDKFDYI